jgi:sec-independent protein translocase protein TatB
MFDIGFAELLIIGVVALLVIGPERLPETVRTASLWLNRIRRGFNEIKQEVQQELHNDSVMQELRKTGQQLKEDTESIGHELKDVSGSLTSPTPNGSSPGEQQESSAKQESE